MRNKKLIQFLVLITLIFLGVKIFNVRSNKKSENNIQTNSLTITSNIEINSLDPIKSNNKNQEYNITNIFDSLYEPNPYKPGQYIPVIADGLPEVSEDRLTINIKIKPDIFFHNNKCFKDGEGRPINSNDIKISLLRALNTLESDSSVNLKDRILGINEWIKSNTELIDYNSDIEGIVIIDGVFEVSYVENLSSYINKNITKVSIILGFFSVILLITLIVLINNTIKIAIYSHRFIIRSMQLVGALPTYIIRPYTYQAIYVGLISGILSNILIIHILNYAITKSSLIAKLQNPIEIFFILIAINCLGILIDYISTYRYVVKYLKCSFNDLY